MNIYNVNKYHPAWGWYIDLEDVMYIGPGIKPTPDQRKALKRRAVDEFMRDNGFTPEYVEGVFKERTAAKKVHRLYGTD